MCTLARGLHIFLIVICFNTHLEGIHTASHCDFDFFQFNNLRQSLTIWQIVKKQQEILSIRLQLCQTTPD